MIKLLLNLDLGELKPADNRTNKSPPEYYLLSHDVGFNNVKIMWGLWDKSHHLGFHPLSKERNAQLCSYFSGAFTLSLHFW